MGWFGNLELAFKYAFVFGSALCLTLLLGVIKLLSDKRKMKKLMKDLEEVAQGRKGTVDYGHSELNIREKDEGDLFGIRAIEAGFYGGIAQSAPTSVANSPSGSRSASPAPGLRTPQGHSPSSSITMTSSRPHTPSNLSSPKNFSGTSSVLTLNQQAQDSHGPEFAQHSPGVLRSTAHNAGMDVRRPMGHSPLGHTYSPKLRPSKAELSGRINHTPIDMSLEVPPSPVSAYHPSRAKAEYEGIPITLSSNAQSYPHQSAQTSLDRTSNESTGSSTSQYHSDSSEESRSHAPPTLTRPSHFGRSPFEVVSLSENSYQEVRSVRPSLVSRSTTSDQWRPQSAEPSRPSPMKLPAFPKNAIIDSSNPQFKGFVQERGQAREPFTYNLGNSSSAEELHRVNAGSGWGYFTAREVQLPISPTSLSAEFPTSSTMQTTSPADHRHSRHSRRTSFSFSVTNPDAYDPEIASYISRSRLGDAPMSSMN